MAGRRISVSLDLDVQRYIDGAVKAALETKALDEEMKGLDRQTAEVSASMDGLAVTSAVAAKEVGEVGEKSNKATRDLSQLDRQIEATRRRVERLGIEFAATGDKVAGKRFGDQQSMLGKLENLRTSLRGLDNDKRPLATILGELGGAAGGVGLDLANVGVGGGPGLISRAATGLGGAGSQIGSVFSGGLTSPGVLAAAGGAATILIPTLGAMVAGAVTGAVGAGGIIGGVVSAIKDPIVQTAFQEFLKDIEAQFFKSGSAFAKPIIDSLAVLAQDFASLHLDDVFATVAPQLQILVQGIGDLIKNLMPGFSLALQRSGPFIKAIADGLAYLGTSLSEFMDHASRSPGAVEGLTTLFATLGGAIKFLGVTLDFLSERFRQFLNFMHGAFGIVDKTLDMIGQHSDLVHNAVVELDAMAHAGSGTARTMFDLGHGLSDVANSADKAAEEAAVLAKSMITVSAAAGALINDAVRLEDANIAVAQGFADLNEKLIRGAGNWTVNTQAGRDNLHMVDAQLIALEQQREAAIAQGVAIEAANTAFESQANFLFRVAGAAGASTAALNTLNEALFRFELTYATSQAIHTAAGVVSAVFAGHRAGGGPVMAGMSYITSEQGSELVDMYPGGGGYVHSAQQWKGVSGGSQQIQLVVSVAKGADRGVVSALTENLRFDVRTASGGSVQTHLGPRR